MSSTKTSESKTSENKAPLNKKTSLFKKLIRFEVIGLLVFIGVILTLYFTLFFTTHLRWIAQKSLSQVYGAEVNIDSIQIKISPPNLKLNRMQFTNHQKPSQNLFEIGEIEFELNPHELLFLSFVSEKSYLTGIKVNTQRSRSGYVNPESQKLMSLSLNLKKNKEAVLNKNSKGNILENILSFSKSKDIKSELSKLSDEFKIDDLTKKYELKLKNQNDILKSYEAFLKTDHMKQIETEFKALQEKSKAESNDTKKALTLISEGKDFLKKISQKKDEVKKIKSQFLAQINEVKNLKSELNKDILEKKLALKAKFKIPDISPESLAKDFFAETVTTRFYLFNFWLEQLRKSSEDQVKNVTSKVLSEKNSAFVKDKAQAYLDSSKNEKSINVEIKEVKKSNNQIIHFGNNVRPKFWIKKSMIQANAKDNQDLQNFKGEILDLASDQKLINKPILVKFQGDLPKENITGIDLSAKINHHVQNINEEFSIRANYPISSFKIVDDGSLKFYLNKASTFTNINGQILKNEINNLKINSEMTSANFVFESTKSDIQNMLKPILDSIPSFNLDVLLNGPIANPDLKILSTLTNKISDGIKAKLASQLSEFTKELESKMNEKTSQLSNKIFGKFDGDESKTTSDLKILDGKLDSQNKLVNDFIKKSSSKSLNPALDKLKNKLFK